MYKICYLSKRSFINSIKQVTGIILFALIVIIFSNQSYAQSNYYMYSPAKGTTVKNNRPVITFSLSGKTGETSSVRIKVNNKDVTDQSVITGMFVSYKPGDSLPVGENFVEVTFKSLEDKTVDFKWSFYVKEFKPIKSVVHDAKTELMEKEKLNVTMEGFKNCKATFDIGAFKRNLPMKEVEPGVYKGTYQVKLNDHATRAPVICKLEMDDGSYYRMKAKETVDIEARFFKIKILTPQNETYVKQSFKLIGRTKPNTIVKVATGFTFGSSIPKPRGGITIEVDENGRFEETLGFPISMSNMKMLVKAHAIDRKGNESMPVTITVYLKRSEPKPEDGKQKDEDKKKEEGKE